MLIHLCVEPAEIVHAEVAECGPFVINEEASVFYGWLFRYHTVIGRNLKCRHLRRLYIKPVDKRGDAEHLGELEETIDGAALVASGYYKS